VRRECAIFIRTLDELEKLGRIKSPLVNDAFRSARFLTAADRMGYSYNEKPGQEGHGRCRLAEAPLGGQLHHLRQGRGDGFDERR